jgi:TPR repeat
MIDLQNYEIGLADFDRVVRLDPNNAINYYTRGILKANHLQDYQGAFDDFNCAIQLNPMYAFAYLKRGNLKCERFQDYPGALKDYDRAIELDPKFASAYKNRAVLKANYLDDILGAAEDAKQAAKFDRAQGDRAGYQTAIDRLKQWQGNLTYRYEVLKRSIFMPKPNYMDEISDRIFGLIGHPETLHLTIGAHSFEKFQVSYSPENTSEFTSRLCVTNQPGIQFRFRHINNINSCQITLDTSQDLYKICLLDRIGIGGVVIRENYQDVFPGNLKKILAESLHLD